MRVRRGNTQWKQQFKKCENKSACRLERNRFIREKRDYRAQAIVEDMVMCARKRIRQWSQQFKECGSKKECK